MQLNYELAASDMVASQRLFMRHKRPFVFWGFPVWGCGLLLFGLFVAFSQSFIVALPMLIISVYFALIPSVIIPLGSKGVWDKTPTLHGATTLSLAVDGLEIANPLSRAAMRGQAIQFTVQDARMWMLFLGPASYYLVPKRAFTSPEQLAEFERTIANFVAMSAPAAPIAAP